MKVLVVIVTYNALRWAKMCFDSIYSSSIDLDVYVVDNGSTDGTQKFIQENFPKVVFYQSKTNLGFGRANNLGLKYALKEGYEYVYLLNQDAWVLTDTIKQLIEIQQKNPQYGIISPLQCQRNGKKIDAHFGRRMINYGKNIEILNDLLLTEIKDVYDVEFVMAAHWLISRECILINGGFSPTFVHYGEDGNYIHRVIFNGFKVGVSPKAKAIHDRENRKIDLKKRFKIMKMGYFAIYSDPNKSFWESSKAFGSQLFRNIMKYPSFFHINVVMSVLLSMNMIRKNRKNSVKSKIAFL